MTCLITYFDYDKNSQVNLKSNIKIQIQQKLRESEHSKMKMQVEQLTLQHNDNF